VITPASDTPIGAGLDLEYVGYAIVALLAHGHLPRRGCDVEAGRIEELRCTPDRRLRVPPRQIGSGGSLGGRSRE
jgi:hypothetical protein